MKTDTASFTEFDGVQEHVQGCKENDGYRMISSQKGDFEMGLGKTFRKSVKSTKDLATTYQVCKKLCEDGKLKMKQDELNSETFLIQASEPMKWITTNWPNSIALKGEVFDGKVIVSLEAESKGTSITQDKNISDFLNNFADSLENYVS